MINSDITDIPRDITKLEALIESEQHKLKSLSGKSQEIRTAQPDTNNNGSPGQKIKKHEIALRTWKTIAFLKQATTPSTIDNIEIPENWPEPFHDLTTSTFLSNPKDAKRWKTISNPEEIEYYLMLRNRLHFGKAEGTPFTTQPLSNDIPWGANSQKSEEILQGTYIPQEHVSEICKEVIYACQQRDENPTISPTLSYEVFRGKLRKWRESTVTSPSGRHLGRYKSLFSKGLFTQGDEEFEEFSAKQEIIAKLIVEVINYCIRKGHVLKRWLTVINTMICKDIGNFKIHRLRVLHLYEADFNLLLGVKWRELIMKGDQRNWINEKQHGGRPGCEATTPVLYEVIRTDICYSTRRSLTSVDNDADSCFDRMIARLISLNNRAYGLPSELALLHGTALQQTKYHLRTSTGISSKSYQHGKDFPIHGTGQGSGNSPALWLLMSATLFDVYDEKAYGATFQDPSGYVKVKATITGFVDDTNSCVNE